MPTIPMLLAADAAPGGGLGPLPILIVVFAIFYFIVIRPGSKDRKKREAQVKALKKHDKVITNGGLHATVAALDADTVTLLVDAKQNVRMRYSRTAIWQIVQPGEKPEEPKA